MRCCSRSSSTFSRESTTLLLARFYSLVCTGGGGGGGREEYTSTTKKKCSTRIGSSRPSARSVHPTVCSGSRNYWTKGKKERNPRSDATLICNVITAARASAVLLFLDYRPTIPLQSTVYSQPRRRRRRKVTFCRRVGCCCLLCLCVCV